AGVVVVATLAAGRADFVAGALAAGRADFVAGALAAGRADFVAGALAGAALAAFALARVVVAGGAGAAFVPRRAWASSRARGMRSPSVGKRIGARNRSHPSGSGGV